MGTNFYLHTDVCLDCGRPKEILHIGKSSMGWRFLFQAHPGLTTWDAWRSALADSKNHIVDEYGQRVAFDLLELWIVKAQHLKPIIGARTVDGFNFWDGDFT